MSDFPSPVGGVGFPPDFAPSVLFAVLYGLLVPLVAYRLFHRRSRTTLLIGTTIFSVERIAIFALRAIQSRNATRRVNKGLATYMQVSFGLGYIGLASDLINIVRCLLINPTYGPTRFPESPAASTKDCSMEPPGYEEQDRPKERFWARRFADFANLAFLSATVPGIVANSRYNKAIEGAEGASQRTYILRYASSAVALFLMVVVVFAVTWSLLRQRRAGKRGILAICAIASLTGTISIYRLSIMLTKTTALDSTAPRSQNTPTSKTLFYIFHVAPEWLASLILFGVNIRKACGTGAFGDWRGRDETEREKEKRLKREGRRRQKKAQKEAGKSEAVIEKQRKNLGDGNIVLSDA